MKEIVNRLHENRQVAIAKEILESNGYKVTKESLKESGYAWTGMGWKGAPGEKYYANEYFLDDDHRTGIVYGPEDPRMDGEEGYIAEIIGTDEEAYDVIEDSPLFYNEKNAKAWVEDYFNHTEK